jgi:hypothetical protein
LSCEGTRHHATHPTPHGERGVSAHTPHARCVRQPACASLHCGDPLPRLHVQAFATPSQQRTTRALLSRHGSSEPHSFLPPLQTIRCRRRGQRKGRADVLTTAEGPRLTRSAAAWLERPATHCRLPRHCSRGSSERTRPARNSSPMLLGVGTALAGGGPPATGIRTPVLKAQPAAPDHRLQGVPLRQVVLCNSRNLEAERGHAHGAGMV